ncbi:hypothetical protein GGR53DRAFT_530734 [Hypoxylon sp. FL1150]|nr:hypothetical protein GGR53DRAFT_530734 [Hypoxylon sp. FL1150]
MENHELLKVSKEGDIDVVRKPVEEKVANDKSGGYDEALLLASTYGHQEILLTAGADVHQFTGGSAGDTRSALHAASQGAHEKVIQRLIDAGASVNETVEQSEECTFAIIYTAADLDNETIIEDLLYAGVTINPTDDYRRQPFLITLHVRRVWKIMENVQPRTKSRPCCRTNGSAHRIASRLCHFDSIETLVKPLAMEHNSVRAECMNRALPSAALRGRRNGRKRKNVRVGEVRRA